MFCYAALAQIRSGQTFPTANEPRVSPSNLPFAPVNKPKEDEGTPVLTTILVVSGVFLGVWALS